MRLETKTRNPKPSERGDHWKSKRGRPRKPAPPVPAVHCQRCRGLVSSPDGRVMICLNGKTDFDAPNCEFFRDCSVRQSWHGAGIIK